MKRATKYVMPTGSVGASPAVGEMMGSTYAALTRIERHRAGFPRFVTPELPPGGTITLEEYRRWERRMGLA